MQEDINLLHAQFRPRQRSPPKKRVLKEKRKRARINQKIRPLHVERFIELREKFNYSYEKIGEIMTVKPMTVFAALKRYAARGTHVDMRAYNG